MLPHPVKDFLLNPAKACVNPAMSSKAIQTAFFEQLAHPASIRAIFEHIPEVYFFIKDRQSRLVSASPSILARLGMRREADFIGKSDFEVFPRHLADAFVADDALVFRTAKPLVNRLELWLNEQRRPDWCITTKVPLFGKKGQVVGLMGVSRHDSGNGPVQPASEVTRAVEFIRQNVSRVLTTAELADAAKTSERTLYRKVRQEFGIPPYELVLRLRIQMAAEALLHPHENIAAVANAHGFCDQSSFTMHFRKRMGMTPKEFLRGHRTGNR